MENNFYVGNIFHRRRIRQISIDCTVLYTEDNYHYLDLISGKWYDIDTRKKDYVIRDSIRTTDIDDYRIDYKHLLSKYNSKKKIKSTRK